MMTETNLEIFLVAIPGLEELLRAEAIENGFRAPKVIDGGVSIKGGWRDVWRANLVLRGASRVLVRLGSFPVQHLAELDKKARKFPWGETLRKEVPLRVEVTSLKSRIYHESAAVERIERALIEDFGAVISGDAEVCLKVRLHKDVCTISVDSSGQGLHKRGYKEAVNKAPLRETMAALLLRHCGYRGAEPVVDPMCGSGTFVIEAAEIAARLAPGRARSFAFEQFANFDADIWQEVRTQSMGRKPEVTARFYGFDRDNGAIGMSVDNAARAGIDRYCQFQTQVISELSAPEGPAGLVMINPPYGVRLGEVKKLMPLYQTLGKRLLTHFSGWRVGLLTNDDSLAYATGLPFGDKNISLSHGGIRVKLFVSGPL